MTDDCASPIEWPNLLTTHERWLRTVVYAHTREIQAVDEVMQEVAIAIVKQAETSIYPDHIKPWLHRLAVLQSLLFRRKKGRQRKLEKNYANAIANNIKTNTTNEKTDPLQWLLADETRRLVREALDKLAERDAEILLLKYTQNWSYKQLADHLGRTESAIESRLHRARKKLREQLAQVDIKEANS